MKNIFKTKLELENYLKENDSKLETTRTHHGRFGTTIKNTCIINGVEYDVKKVKSIYYNEWVWIININNLWGTFLEEAATTFIKEN